MFFIYSMFFLSLIYIVVHDDTTEDLSWLWVSNGLSQEDGQVGMIAKRPDKWNQVNHKWTMNDVPRMVLPSKTYKNLSHQTSNISSGSSSTNFPLPLHLVSFSLLRSSPGLLRISCEHRWPRHPRHPCAWRSGELGSEGPSEGSDSWKAPSRTTKWDNHMDTRNVAKLCSQTSIHIFPYHKGIFCSEVTRFWRANLQLHASVRAAAAKVVAYPAWADQTSSNLVSWNTTQVIASHHKSTL